MFEVRREKDKVIVEAKLQKRKVSREPIIFLFTKDAIREASAAFPNLKMHIEKTCIISNTKEPYEGTWIFGIEEERKFNSFSKQRKKKQKEKELQSEPVEEKVEEKLLTNEEESAKIEETSEPQSEDLVQEQTE